jgi:hypothetical protein
LVELIKELSPPLGFENNILKHILYAKIMRMNAPLNDDGTVDFNAALVALVRVQVGLCRPTCAQAAR